MLKKSKFHTTTELEHILEFLGVCCLWMSLSGYGAQAKKFCDSDFVPKKIFKAMRDYEQFIPGWILDALEDVPEYATEKTFGVLLAGKGM